MAKKASRKRKRGYAYMPLFASKKISNNTERAKEKSWQQYVLAHSRTIKY